MDRKLILITCCSIIFMAYGIRYTFSMLLPEMMRDLNLTNAQAGIIYTSFLTLYTLVSVFVGFLIDVKGVKRTVLAFLPLLGIGTGFMSLITSQLSGLLFFGIAGVGAAVCWTPLAIWVQKAYPSKRGRSLGILQVGCNLGFAILGLAIPLMMPYVGWRGCWAILGILTILWLMPLTVIAHEPEIALCPQKTLIEHVKGYSAVLRDKEFWLGGLSYMLSSFAIMVPMTFSKAYATLELGVNPSEATMLFSIMGFSGILGALIIPIVSDKIGRKTSVLICNSIIALGLIGFAFVATTFTDAAFLSVVVGIGYSAIWPLYAALIKDLYSWEVAGASMGLWTLLCGIGLLLSPAIGGFVTDLTGSYKPAYIIGCVATLASIMLATKIKKIIA